MRVDLSKPHQLVGAFCVHTDTGEVYRMDGKKVGVLPEGSSPASTQEILEALNPAPVVVKEEKKPSTFKGVSLAKMRKRTPIKKPIFVGRKRKTKKKGG